MPGSPGGIEVARLSVRVVPDTSTLLPEIREDLEKIERRLRVSVEVEPDTDGFDEKIDEERAKARKQPVKVPVDPLTDAFAARLTRDVKAAAKAVDAEIPITPETAGFRESLEFNLRGIQATIGKIKLGAELSDHDKAELVAEIEAIKAAADNFNVKVDVDAKGLGKTEAELDAFRLRQSKNVKFKVEVDNSSLASIFAGGVSGLSGLLSTVGSIAQFIGLWAVGGTALLSLLPGLISGLGALSALAVGIAAILPAGLFAVAGILGTLVLGFKNVGTAIFGTGKEATDALAALSPAAAAFAQQFKGVFDGLQQDIQERLFTGLAPAVKTALDKLAPIIKTSMEGLTDGLNQVFGGILAAISTDKYAAQFKEFFSQVDTLLTATAVAVGPLIDAFATLGTHVADVVFPRIASAIVSLSTRFDDFITRISANGQLDQFLNQVVDGFSSLVEGLVSIGDAFHSIFEAASAGQGFGGVLQNFQNFTKGIADFLSSDKGAAGMRSFFSALSDAATALAPVLESVFLILAGKVVPIISQLIVGLAPGVVTFLDALGNALGNLEPVARPLGEALGAVVAALAPLLGPLGLALATVFSGVAQALQAIAPTLTQAATLIGTIFTNLAAELGPQLPALAQAFALAFQNMLIALPSIVDSVIALLPLLPQLLILGLQALPLLNQSMLLLIALAPVLIPFLQAMLPLLTSLATAAESFAQWLTTADQALAIFGQGADDATSKMPGVGSAMIGVIPFLLSLTGGFTNLRVAAELAIGKMGDFATTAATTVTTAAISLTTRMGTLAAMLAAQVVSAFASSTSWMSRMGVEALSLGTGAISSLVGWISTLTDFAGRVLVGGLSVAIGVFDRIKGSISGVINFVESLIAKLSTLATRISTLPGLGAISGILGSLPHFAEGGMTLGPQVAVMGDNRGGREVALPLGSRSTIAALSAALREAGGAGLDTKPEGVTTGDLPPIVQDITLLLDGKKVAGVVNTVNLEDAWR